MLFEQELQIQPTNTNIASEMAGVGGLLSQPSLAQKIQILNFIEKSVAYGSHSACMWSQMK